MRTKQNPDLSVYLILDPSLCNGRAPETVLEAALLGGVTCVQYRDKTGSKDNISAAARRLKDIINGRVPFLINDHVDIAKAINADGAHIGQGDMAAREARALLGPDKILGLTAFNEDQIRAVDPAIVDHIGTGPVYPTLTDKGKPVLGVEGFAKMAALSPVPVVGIGGITPETASAVIKAGAAGIAMMRSVSQADDVAKAAKAFTNLKP